MSKLDDIRKNKLLEELKSRNAPKWEINKILFDKQLDFINDSSKYKSAVCSRRCLGEGTLVMTTRGPKAIENIVIGDYVYDENCNPVKVINTFYNGKKEVIEINYNNKTLVKATKDHKFLVKFNKQLCVYKFTKNQKIICNNKTIIVNLGKTTIENTYDIHVASETNLYTLASGLVTHNSGKSVSCAVDLLETALRIPRATLLYITLTRQNAKALVWREIQKLDKDYSIGCVFNNTDLTITLPNESMIYCAGAVHEDEIEKFRGYSLTKVYLDEVQSFKPWIENLVDDILSPATWDNNGQIILIGTPGPMPSGYFFDVTTGAKAHGWSNHHWTIFDNPHIKLKTGRDPEEILAEDRRLKGLTENSPKYIREALGQWVKDSDSLVYRYDERTNHYEELPPLNEMNFVIGIDVGYVDNDAISVIGFHKTKNKAYLVEEFVKTKQDITELTNQIRTLRNYYNPIKMVIDAGALGKKITEEIVRRHGINLEAAEKSRKIEFIELLNDDLRSARFMVKKTSYTAYDYCRVEWDIQSKDRRKVSDKYHGDACDATLYAWRAGFHYLSKTSEVVDSSVEAQINRFWEQESENLEKSKIGDWWD